MSRFSAKSAERLAQCDPRLQLVFNYVVDVVDCTILEGHRDKEAQDELFRQGKSQVQWPDGKHNRSPSLAVDAAAYPIDWNDRERATLFAGVVLGVADVLGIKLRWGGDWDRDWQVKDNNFDDMWHFEIVE